MRIIKRDASGFTLIEVLIALMVLAIALTAVMEATQNSIRNTMHVKRKLSAHWVAMNVVSQMQVGLLTKPVNSQIVHGEARLLGKHFEWVSGVDQKGSGDYERIYVDVKRWGVPTRVEHLIGFVK